MAEQLSNITQQPIPIIAFGFITLPKQYSTEKDVAMSFVTIMSFVSVIANATLLLVIMRDPFKQLRTITAILLAFNSTANLMNSLVLFFDNVLLWRHQSFSQELIIYLGVVTSSLYFIGNLLHIVNIYGAIVIPVRYAHLAPKVRKILVQILCLAWAIILLVIIIPAYTLPKNKIPSYVKALLTMMCVLLGLLAMIFVYLYAGIFKTLYARKQKFTLSFHIQRSTDQGKRIKKKNQEIVRTLFIHVVFFMITTVPGSVVFTTFLYCTSCDQVKLHLAGLFTFPISYAPLSFLPFLWLFRLNNYKRAMKETFSNLWRKITKCGKNKENNVDMEIKSLSGSTKEIF